VRPPLASDGIGRAGWIAVEGKAERTAAGGDAAGNVSAVDMGGVPGTAGWASSFDGDFVGVSGRLDHNSRDFAEEAYEPH
jgi:hypothetical protein